MRARPFSIQPTMGFLLEMYIMLSLWYDLKTNLLAITGKQAAEVCSRNSSLVYSFVEYRVSMQALSSLLFFYYNFNETALQFHCASGKSTEARQHKGK